MVFTQKDKAWPRFVLLRKENESQHVPHSWRERRWQCPCFISIYSYTTWRKCMRVRVQQEQKFLVSTERALWRYDNAFIFTNKSEVDFGITLYLLSRVHFCIHIFLLQILTTHLKERDITEKNGYIQLPWTLVAVVMLFISVHL
jgi:hypothetical protein